MSYGRLLRKERVLEEEIGRWFAEAEREDSAEDEAYGPDDDGYSLPPELRESQKRLQTIRAAKARLEAEARAKRALSEANGAEREGKDVAQTNFTDPDSRIMHTPDGFQSASGGLQRSGGGGRREPGHRGLRDFPGATRRAALPLEGRPMLEHIIELNGQPPAEISADAGYASESNFAALAQANVYAVIALRRYRRDDPPDTDPALAHSSGRWPHRNIMRQRLSSPYGKALYKLRKQTVEPVIGQIKAARGFRQFLCRGLAAVQAEWTLVCTAHNLLKLHQALAVA